MLVVNQMSTNSGLTPPDAVEIFIMTPPDAVEIFIISI
jgi:hypothetical protein